MINFHLLHKPCIEIRLLWAKSWTFVSKQIWNRSFTWFDFNQGAAKISEVKVGDGKKSANPGCIGSNQDEWANIFFNLQLWPFISLLRLDLEECTVPYSKDLIHICSEPEAQGCGMTFNVCYLGSKYPYFVSYRGKWVYLFYSVCSFRI